MKKYVRAEVTPDFVNAMIEIAKGRIARFAQDLEYATPRMKDRMRAEKAPIVARLSQLRTADGRDMEVTRLRSLPYTKFELVTHKDIAYLAAHTQPIRLVEWRGNKASTNQWDLGVYTIYTRVEHLKLGSAEGTHFVPNEDPMTLERHPHHRAYNNVRDARHPLDYSPSTCWGSYGAIVSSCAVNGDIVELFRSLYSYVTRYNPGSPLVHGFVDQSFAKEVYAHSN